MGQPNVVIQFSNNKFGSQQLQKKNLLENMPLLSLNQFRDVHIIISQLVAFHTYVFFVYTYKCRKGIDVLNISLVNV